MDNFPDKDIDYLFKKGSEKHNFPFKESSWKNMDTLLEKEVKKRQWKRWSLLLLLLISITGIGLISYSKITNTFSATNDDTNEVLIATGEKTEKILDQKITSSETDTRTLENTTRKKELTVQKKANLIDKQVDLVENKTVEQRVNTQNSSTINKQLKASQVSKNNSLILGKEASDLVKAEGLQNADIQLASTLIKTNNTLSIEKTLLPRTTFNMQPIPFGLLNPLKFDNTYTDKVPVPSFDATAKNRWMLGLTLGREVSSVGMMNNSKKGYRVGIELAYQFNNRFQVSTGFIASEKKYETPGTNYLARVDRWVNEIVPEMVQGTCDIFEIPLDFTYYFKGYQKSSFFINGGFNAYLMRKEWYDYEYQSGTNMDDLPISWTGKMTNNHVVSSFAIGYQRILSDKLTLQVAPYTQIPFSGIGDGQVKLYTTGLQVKVLFGKK